MTPGVGGCWVGYAVGLEALPEVERASVEVPEGYTLVRCRDRRQAPVHVGVVYLVLDRFLAEQ